MHRKRRRNDDARERGRMERYRSVAPAQSPTISAIFLIKSHQLRATVPEATEMCLPRCLAEINAGNESRFLREIRFRDDDGRHRGGVRREGELAVCGYCDTSDDRHRRNGTDSVGLHARSHAVRTKRESRAVISDRLVKNDRQRSTICLSVIQSLLSRCT